MLKQQPLKIKLSIICIFLVTIPTFIIGGFSYHQFILLGDKTVNESYAALKEQTLAIMQASVKIDRQVIINVIGKVVRDAKTLSTSSSIHNYLSARLGKNEVFNRVPEKEAAIIANNIYQMCQAQRQILYKKLSTDLAVLEKILEANGGAELTGLSIEWSAIDQYTSDIHHLVLPILQIGFDEMRGIRSFDQAMPVVDEAKEVIDGSCSIFQRINEQGDMLLVGTTMVAPDGQRAISYYMPSILNNGQTNPVISAIMQGNQYKGRAYIVNEWFISAFKPLKDTDGKIIGMLNVGTRETDNVSVINMINNTVIGKTGYPLIFDSNGTIIMHPKKQFLGKNIIEDLKVNKLSQAFDIIYETKHGIFNYTYDGRRKFIYYRYYEAWDWVISATGYWDEFNQEQTAKEMLMKEIKAIAENASIAVDKIKHQAYHCIRYIDEKGYEIVRYQNKMFVNTHQYVGNKKWFRDTQFRRKGIVEIMGVIVDKGKVILRIATPLRFENKNMGVISIDFNWQILCQLIKQHTYKQDNQRIMIDPTGKIIIHPELSLLDRVSLLNNASAELQNIVKNRMLQGISGQDIYTDQGKRYLIVYTPITMGSQVYSYGIKTAESSCLSIANNIKQNTEDSFGHVVQLLGLAGTMMIICGVLAAYFMTSRIIQPIVNISKITEKIADYDLTVYIEDNRDDEIGQLNKAIEKMLVQFRKLIGEAQISSKGLADTSRQMVEISNNLVDIYGESNTQATNVASASKEMTSNINAIASTTSDMSAHTKSVNKKMERMSKNINFVTTSIEQMAKSMNNVHENADQGVIITRDAMKQATELKYVMTTLQGAANEIDDVTTLIKGIADKTNLLALNAAIEAASAGNAGKGFAIVANAIQRFAEQNTNAAEDIAERIYHVQEKTTQAFKSISTITDIIERVHTTSETIRSVIEEQSLATDHILSKTRDINTISNDIVLSMNDVKDNIFDVNNRLTGTSAGALQVSQNVHQVSLSIESSNQSINKVNYIADQLNTLSRKYQKLVDIFQLGSDQENKASFILGDN